MAFCFDPQTNDYRVVRTVWTELSGVTGRWTEIYSLNSDTWREKKCKLDFMTISPKCDTIVNGEPYWWAFYGSSMLWWGFFAVVQYLGRCLSLVNYKNSLGVLIDCELTLSSLLGEYLGLGSSNYEHAERTINLLVLDRSDKSWRVELRIGFPHGIGRVIGCSTSGRLVLEDKSGSIVLLDTENENVENVSIAGAMARSFEICNYMASSVPIKGSEQVTGEANGSAYTDSYNNETERPWKRPRGPIKGQLTWIGTKCTLLSGPAMSNV